MGQGTPTHHSTNDDRNEEVAEMFKFVAVLACVASLTHAGDVGGYGSEGGYAEHGYGHGHQEIYAPQPYKFGYEIVDEYGNKQSRHEVSDEHNVKKGSYSFTDAHGISRRVEYIADAHGFRATVHTNEPGTETSNPAGAQYIGNPSTYSGSYGYGHH